MKKNSLYFSAIFLLSFFCLIIIITSIIFLLGFNISYISLLCPFILSILFVILFYKKDSIKVKSIGIFIGIIVLILFSFISSKYYDLTWDSNTYHKDAVGALKNGWNPIHENYIDFYKKSNLRDSNIIGNKIDRERGLWQTHYCKGAWMVNANFYYLYNNIEKAKIFNLVLIYISIIFSYFFCLNFTNRKVLSFFLAILFSITPVTLIQMFSYYNDGPVYNLVLLTVLSFILFMKNDKKRDISPWLFSSMVLCINIKFTGLAYAGVICFFIYLAFLYLNRKKLNTLIKPTIFIVLTALFSILVVGFSPYVTNTINNHHPFYPLKGKNSVDIMTHNTPSYFNDNFRIKNLLISLGSKSESINQKSPNNPKIKIPFTISKEELQALQSPDLRVAGFGVLFFPALVISSIIILVYLIILYKKNKKVWLVLTSIVLSILSLCFIIKESWWARYTPYIYLVLPLALFLLLAYPIFKNKINNVIILLLLSISFLNLSFYQIYNINYNYSYVKETKKVLNKYKKNNKTMEIIETSEPFIGSLYNLDDNNIKYKMINYSNTYKIDKIFKVVPYKK